MSHTSASKDRLVARVRRITGQLAAIERAIETEAGCAAILHQVAGARGAIAGLMEELVEDHVREHVAHPGLSEADRTAGAEELIAVLRRYGK
jgi:FrmR/RcnR family transcriptional regulator, repressor of frmRAB operon